MAGLPETRPLLCYITDRRGVGGEDLLGVIDRVVAAGAADLIQIREKDMATRPLLALVETAVAAALVGHAMAHQRAPEARILVNDRLDVALAAKADGVH
ncbi:MAG: thiamine phosphate synthase, partial [Candidatus Acidiferrales bacterium]